MPNKFAPKRARSWTIPCKLVDISQPVLGQHDSLPQGEEIDHRCRACCRNRISRVFLPTRFVLLRLCKPVACVYLCVCRSPLFFGICEYLMHVLYNTAKEGPRNKNQGKCAWYGKASTAFTSSWAHHLLLEQGRDSTVSYRVLIRVETFKGPERVFKEIGYTSMTGR